MSLHAPSLTTASQRVGLKPLIPGGPAEADRVRPVPGSGGGIANFQCAGASSNQIKRGPTIFNRISPGGKNRMREDQSSHEREPLKCHYFSLMTTSNPVSPAASRAQ